MNIYGKYIKRLLDILFAILFMFILILPMIFIGILVFLYDWDYPLFIQKRYGLNSETFNIIKIRTMKKDTPEVANGKFMDMKFYLTPLGGFLRKTSLDEIPQLFNVLSGQMSFVGPRPLADTDMNVVEARRRNGADQVRPGITGLAQVNGRNQITDDDKAKMDARYARKLSLLLDLQILIKTVGNVFMQVGINSSKVQK